MYKKLFFLLLFSNSLLIGMEGLENSNSSDNDKCTTRAETIVLNTTSNQAIEDLPIEKVINKLLAEQLSDEKLDTIVQNTTLVKKLLLLAQQKGAETYKRIIEKLIKHAVYKNNIEFLDFIIQAGINIAEKEIALGNCSLWIFILPESASLELIEFFIKHDVKPDTSTRFEILHLGRQLPKVRHNLVDRYQADPQLQERLKKVLESLDDYIKIFLPLRQEVRNQSMRPSEAWTGEIWGRSTDRVEPRDNVAFPIAQHESNPNTSTAEQTPIAPFQDTLPLFPALDTTRLLALLDQITESSFEI